MTVGETTRGASASVAAEEISPECRISASDATRYLSAAPHLRRGMLREKIIGPRQPATPPQPVGRPYAIQVLFGAQRAVPMPAVDSGEVRGQCVIALLQTMIRDIVAVVALIVSALLEPWGTAIIFGLAVAVIILMGRVRLFSVWTLTAVAAVVIVLFSGVGREEARFIIPLICLGVCYAVFLADILLSVHHLRRLWDISSAQRDSKSADPAQDGRSADEEEISQDGQGVNQQNLGRDGPRRVYHDSSRIIGSGTPLDPLAFHVSLENRLDEDKPITEFKASELVRYICSHVTSQSVSGMPENGRASEARPEARSGRQAREGHFTGGLPYLQVTPVISVPIPKARKHSILRFSTARLNYDGQPFDKELLDAVDRPQVGQKERYYVRVITPSWKGQIVNTIYCHAAIEADSLSVTIKPYVLTPIDEQLRVADELIAQSRFLMTGKAIRMTARQFLSAVHRINHAADGGSAAADEAIYSPRELYAGNLLENTNQRDDAIRITRVLQAKVVRTTMKFLRLHNIDPNEDERRSIQTVYSYTIIGDIISTGPNSQVANAKGDNIKQSNKAEKTDTKTAT